MTPFHPFHPAVLAIAQELQARSDAEPGSNLLGILGKMMEERPAISPQAYATMAQQINDLMVLSQPADDRLRLALMLFLPNRRGSLFTASEMLLRDALFFPTAPCTGMARDLAVNLDEKWPEVVQTIKMMPLPPMALAGANGLPIEAKHPAAAGPLPVNIQDFMKPDRP